MKKCLLFLLVVSGFAVSGCIDLWGTSTATPVEIIPTSTHDTPVAYSLKALDPINIRFSGVPDQQMLEVVIDEKGEINLLHLSTPIKAAGLTTSALEEKIERLYVEEGIYTTLGVNVVMTAKSFFVQGEVYQPGEYQLKSGTTLQQAIAMASGYNPYADKKHVRITRKGQVFEINVKEIEENPSRDIAIEAGDIIFVREGWL